MSGLNGKKRRDPVLLNHTKSSRGSHMILEGRLYSQSENYVFVCTCVRACARACMYHWDVSEIPLGEFWGSRLEKVPVSSSFSVICNLTRPDFQVDNDQTLCRRLHLTLQYTKSSLGTHFDCFIMCIGISSQTQHSPCNRLLSGS